MNIVLWIIQVVLGGFFIFAGVMKFVVPVDQMAGQFGNEIDVRSGLVEDNAVDALHVSGHQLDKRGKLGGRVARVFQWYDNPQDGPLAGAAGLQQTIVFGTECRSRQNAASAVRSASS